MKKTATPTVTATGKLIDFTQYLTHSDTFIETGTCHGRTVKTALENGYKKVISVEAYHPFYQKCVETFKGNENVSLYEGKSTDQLSEMIKEANKRVVFWLDAHPSGPQTAGHDDLMSKGDTSEYHQDTIILKELEIILSTGAQHVIIIDDQNGYTDSVKKIIEKVEEIRPGKYNYSFYDEQMGPNFYENKILICLPK